MKTNQPTTQQVDNSARQQDNQNTANGGSNQQSAPKREVQISQATKERAEALKAYVERKYSRMKVEEQEKREAWEMLHKKMDNLNLSTAEQELIKRDIIHKESERYRQKRKPITIKDFEPVDIIGRGAFGEVRVCKIKETGEIVAVKKMNKSEMIYKNQVAHVRAEKDILASAANPWIVELKFSFQDEKYLYLVMEYLPGGDLMTLLMKKDILSEDEAKFYIAEAILAVDSVHKLNYIHRDLKPDNILLDAKGHIKLSDFGLCKHTEIKPRKFEFQKKVEEPQPDLTSNKGILNKKPVVYKRNRQLAYSTVGTPDYIAPEVFGHNGYTETVDWWSLGVILFEMLVGYPPFFSEDPSMTCQKILHWRKTLVIPPEANLSPAAVDLLKKMISDANERLGVNGVEEIKIHPFFAGVDWKRIREKKAPNIPDIKNEVDTSNFDKFEEEDPWYSEDTGKKRGRKDPNFVGYTFKREIDQQRSHLVTALQDLEFTRLSQPRQKEVIVQPTPTQVTTTSSTTKTQNPQLSSNIMSAINSINQMNSMHSVFPASSTTASSLNSLPQNSTASGGTTTSSTNAGLGNSNVNNSQNKGGGAGNYTAYESTQSTTTTTYGGMFSTGSKSPTNATTNKEPNKYAQYIPREIPLRSNNLNPTSKIENTSNPYTSEQIKKKEINIATNNPDMNFMMKNKFTPTNNTTATTGGIGGIGASGKILAPTTDVKKPTETYTSSIKTTLTKPGITYTTTTSTKQPLGRK